MPSIKAETLDYRPLCPTFGAEVLGLDLAAPISAGGAESLLDAYRRYRLLLVRGQEINAEQQARFGQIFGRIKIREHNRVAPIRADEQHVSNVRKDGVFGRGELKFHMDQLFYPEPLAALILYGIEVTDEGGGTDFCDTEAALAAIPDALRARMEAVVCRTTRAYDNLTARLFNVSNDPETIVSTTHRMIWTEPGSGRRVIWCGRPELTSIEGLDKAASDAFVGEVLGYVDDCEAVYHHQWRPNDLVLWNNRTLFHARVPYDETKPRTLRRTPLMEAEAA